MRLSLVLTHQCDLACGYCYTGRKDARRMSPEVGRRAIDRAVRGLERDEPLELLLFGGEPLLEWELGRELIDYARRRLPPERVLPQVTTNGTHLREAVLDEALARGVSLAVSMDGLPAVHDAARPQRGGQPSSQAALAAIARLVARDADFQVVSVIHPDNLAQVGAGARFLVDRGVRHLVHTLDFSASWSEDRLPLLARAAHELRELLDAERPRLRIDWIEAKSALLSQPELPKFACGTRAREVAVAPSGRLYPCERLVGEDPPGAALAFGHLDDDEGPLPRFPGSSRPDPQSACAPCDLRSVCRNDCACANLARGGALDRPDGLVCAVEQSRTEAAAASLRLRAGLDPSAPSLSIRRLPLRRAVQEVL